MPKQVDHQQRRTQLADALWRIAARDGLEAASVRQVAAEAGFSVGLVQHYFSTKDEMLFFALQRVGEDLGARITGAVLALPEPRDPYDVIRTVLVERLPRNPEQRLHVHALVAWLGRSVANPELAEYMTAGTRVLRDHLADQLRQGQRSGRLSSRVDPELSADGLLAFTDGLSSHLLQGLHTPESALAVLDEQLGHLVAASR